MRQLTDANGVVTLAQSYRPFGDTLSSEGDGSSVFQFTGEMRDSTGLTYLRARYLDTWDGRFISHDSWGGDYFQPMSFNAWLYGFGDPVMMTDPSGQKPWCPPGEEEECVNSAPPYPSPGSSGWEKNQPSGVTFYPLPDPLVNGAGGIPRNTNKAQYLDSNFQWLSDRGCDDKRDYCNLCGQISVAAVLNNVANLPISVQRVMKNYATFANNNPPYGKDLLDGTSKSELVAFVNDRFGDRLSAKEFDWFKGIFDYPTSWQGVGRGIDGTNQQNMRDLNSAMRGWFSTPSFPIVGVWINNQGIVQTPYTGGGSIKHWVVLTGISAQYSYDDGEFMRYSENKPLNHWKWRWVRIYNPFDNQTEYYPLQYFLESWNADGNDGIHLRKDYRPPLPPAKCDPNQFMR